jgi:hypothetical protein
MELWANIVCWSLGDVFPKPSDTDHPMTEVAADNGNGTIVASEKSHIDLHGRVFLYQHRPSSI